ncbi:MAG TPA: sigma-70 family RNA polymerase sigma factor [Mycobacteriales bacterium]|nr:sigma-70 family RNA polymerase sigma factor [Mycobacteriales bacterium]
MQGGDEDARRARFELLARELWAPLHRYLARRADPQDAEDLLADVLLVLWRRLDEVPQDYALPWAYRVAQGCLANARRSQQRRLRLLHRLRDEPPLVAVDDPDLTSALGRLRHSDREVLRLWAWEGLEPRDLAVVLGITANAAAVRLSRARSALRNELGKDRPGAGQKPVREEEVPR